LNTAVALVLSRSAAGVVDPVQLRRSLEQRTPMLAGVGWDEPPLELPEGGAGLDALSLLASQVAQAQALNEMRASGRASLLLFTGDELESALAAVPVSDVHPSDRWLEAEPLGDGRWVAYPQDESPALRVQVWLPVPAGPEVTRLVALDTGIDVSTGEAQAPAAPPATCDIGFSRRGEQVCVAGSCSGRCQDSWRYIRGEHVLVSCTCS